MKTTFNLRTQLLFLVGGPLLVLLLVETFVSYRIGLNAADQVFDGWLVDSAFSIAQEIRSVEERIFFVAEPTAIEVFEWDNLDQIYYQVINVAGELITGSDSLRAAAPASDLVDGPVFSDQQLNGRPIRGVSVYVPLEGGPDAIVTVAETLNKRASMTTELLAEVLVSKALLFLAVLLVIGTAFDRGLSPLVSLNHALARRSPYDLTPITIERAPEEVRNLLDNVNQLLARIDIAINSREQFIGNIAHQIRTPLAGIKLQAQLAQRETDLDNINTGLERISHATDQMSHVNTQLMKLAKAEAASGRGLQSEQIDLIEITENCRDELMSVAKAQQITIDVQVPDRPIYIKGELALAKEMIWNLMENAVHYGQPGGHVWVWIEETPGYITLSVEDDGPGIDRQHWPRIFDRFFRPVKNAPDGCGLGLAIVQEIAVAHDAHVHLESPESGKGIRFVVRFDLRA